MWFHTQFSINWKIHLTYKPRLKENSKKQALWQFKSYQIEVLWNTGNRNTGLQGTFRGTLSLQINSDLKEPRWLLTSIPQKPIAAFNHPNQHVGIRQHQTVSDRHQSEKGFISRSGPILSPQQVFSPLRFSYTRQWPIFMLLTIMPHRLKSHLFVVTPSIHFKAHGHLFRNRTLSF